MNHKQHNPVYGLRSTVYESGQTLIETIVAIFVLTTGLSAGLGLAIFAFGSASEITERITATGLAREGIEVTRRMRDSNWLAGTLVGCGGVQQCYQTWLTAPYGISGTLTGRAYRLEFNPASVGNKWTLVQSNNYRLTTVPGSGFTHSGTETQNFFRKIFIIHQTTADPAAETQILVRSVVWWYGKNCPVITDYNVTDDTKCKIVTEEILTNWKNY